MISAIKTAGWMRVMSIPLVVNPVATAGESVALPPIPEKLPVTAFGNRPFLEAPILSPSGDMVAARVDVAGKPKLAIINLFDKTQGKRFIGVGDYKIRWYDWAGSDRLLISLRIEAHYEATEVIATRLLCYELSTGKATLLGGKEQGFVGDDVLFIADDGSFILMGVQKDVFTYPSVQRVDLATAEMKTVQVPVKPIFDWYADKQGVLRAGVGYLNGRIRMIYRDSADERYRVLVSARLAESDGEIDTFRIRPTGGTGYVVSNVPTGRFGLYEFDWKTSEIGKPIFENPTVDIDEVYMTEDGNGIESVTYTDDRERVIWFEPKMKEVQAEIDKALPGRSNWVTSWNRDRTKFIVWTGTANDPGHYYYFNRATARMERIATPYEGLRNKKLANVQATSYKARDGLDIPAYLTLPVGREPKNLPLILLPHGGPYARDSLTFDPWVQFLANRGYAVLQPNFRGSAGYGKDFLTKGFGQWGGSMQDDLTDGVNWLISEGIADPKRICIFGASYGGYAALMGAIKTPDLFRCAISYAGVTDVDEMMSYDRTQMLPARYRNWRNRVQGEAKVDLRDVSPVNRAKEVTIPVLLAHGTDDDNVPFRQAEKFVKAMGKANKPLEFIEFPEVGHNIEDSADRVRFLTAVEAFLATNNPAD